jgi:hypothetical protein
MLLTILNFKFANSVDVGSNIANNTGFNIAYNAGFIAGLILLTMLDLISQIILQIMLPLNNAVGINANNTAWEMMLIFGLIGFGKQALDADEFTQGFGMCRSEQGPGIGRGNAMPSIMDNCGGLSVNKGLESGWEEIHYLSST